jgi:hypothetical protein
LLLISFYCDYLPEHVISGPGVLQPVVTAAAGAAPETGTATMSKSRLLPLLESKLVVDESRRTDMDPYFHFGSTHKADGRWHVLEEGGTASYCTAAW